MTRRSTGLAAVAGALAVAPLVGLVGLVMLAGMQTQAQAAACGASGPAVTVDTSNLPGGQVAGYAGDQLNNAAAIINAGKAAGLDVKGQTIGVMVAMDEAGLRVLDYGDAAGPDSRGLFQQRTSWGPLAVRLDPAGSAGLFFAALAAVPGWEAMTPTLAAHAVQRNADPFTYAKFWDPAVAVVTALAGVPVTAVSPGTGNLPCTGSAPAGGVGGDGWVNPDPGAVLSSGFGWRGATAASPAQLHAGQDLAAACGSPIYAVHAGLITRAGPATGFGDAIYEDVGGGVVVIYGHEFPDGIEVHVGDQVNAGQEIGKVGSNGQSTGCHDHLQVDVNGTPVDPLPFLVARGVTLG